jgi:hypothetical protein
MEENMNLKIPFQNRRKEIEEKCMVGIAGHDILEVH